MFTKTLHRSHPLHNLMPIAFCKKTRAKDIFLEYAIMLRMTTKEREQKLEALVEQKILEVLGDPDSGLELKKSFVAELQKRMKKKQKFIPMSAVAKKYGLR